MVSIHWKRWTEIKFLMSKSSISYKSRPFIILPHSIVHFLMNSRFSISTYQMKREKNTSPETEHNQATVYRVQQEGKWNRKNRITTTTSRVLPCVVFCVHGVNLTVPIAFYLWVFRMKFTCTRMMYWISSHSVIYTHRTMETQTNRQIQAQPSTTQAVPIWFGSMKIPHFSIIVNCFLTFWRKKI